MSSMTKSEVLALAKRIGAEDSANLQARASAMDGTALIAEEAKIISFEEAKRNANMLTRERGFVCTYGAQVYQLGQPYDSDTYSGTPDTLPAQWSLKHTKAPERAKPFVDYNTSRSMYMTGDCCVYNDHVWQSGQDNNTWVPGTLNVKWTDLGAVENRVNQ